jgi:hypothetical protein
MVHKLTTKPITQDARRRLPVTYDSGFEHSLEHLIQVQHLVDAAARTSKPQAGEKTVAAKAS